jgi:hypothetical protein
MNKDGIRFAKGLLITSCLIVPLATSALARAGAPVGGGAGDASAVLRGVGHWTGSTTAFTPDGQQAGTDSMTLDWTEEAPGVAKIVSTFLAPGQEPRSDWQIAIADPNDPSRFEVFSDRLTGAGECLADACVFYASTTEGIQISTFVVIEGDTMTVDAATLSDGKALAFSRTTLTAGPPESIAKKH